MQVEQAYGFVAVRRTDNADLYLLVCQRSGWSFPKGHIEPGELPLAVAHRETEEETGITEVTVIPGYKFKEEYSFTRRDVVIRKQNIYFLATIPGDPKIRPQPNEILECRFAPFEEALRLLETENRKRILTEARDALARIPHA